MIEFGLHLRQARENRGLSLRQIASATKIATVALEALEKGDFSRLPGGIFSRAFVRAYAIEVGLDPDETTRQYTELAELHALTAQSKVAHAEISDDDRAFLERQRQAGVWLRVVLVLILALIASTVAWWYMRRPAKITPVITREEKSSTSATPPAEPSADASAPAATAQSTAPVAPINGKAVVIKLNAAKSCWVSVAADGRQLFSRTLTSGESQTIEADREVALQFGDAGAIAWTINGKVAKPLGSDGEVKKATVTKDTIAQFLQ